MAPTHMGVCVRGNQGNVERNQGTSGKYGPAWEKMDKPIQNAAISGLFGPAECGKMVALAGDWPRVARS